MATPQELEDLRRLEELAAAKDAPSPLMTGLKSGFDDIARGFGKQVASIPGTLQRFNPLQQMMQAAMLAQKGASLGGIAEAAVKVPEAATKLYQGKVEAQIPTPAGDPTWRQYLRAGLEGAGSMVGGAPQALAKAPKAAIAAAMGGGMGAKAGGGFAKDINPALEPLGQLAGGLIGGGIPGFLTGPSQTKGQSLIRQNSENISPESWKKANENVDAFSRAGTTTATLPELFPGRNSLLGLAETVRGDKGGEKLAARTENRAGDVQALGQKYLDNIGPEVSPNGVATRVADAAEALKKNLNDLKNIGMSNRLEGASIRPDKVAEFERALLAAAKDSPYHTERAMYQRMAQTLRHPETKALITDTNTISRQIYEAEKALKAPGGLNTGGVTITAGLEGRALKNAKEGLGEISPVFDEARADLAAFNNGPRTALARSPIDALADRTPNTHPVPATRLNKIVDGTTPAETGDVVKSLARDPGLGVSQRVDPLEIARALGQQKLAAGSTNPGNTVRGQPGSINEAKIAEILTAGGKDPKAVMEPLAVADQLQNFKNLPGMREAPDQVSVGSAVIRPKRAADFFMTERGREQRNQEISSLFMSPTRENLRRLQEIAEFDPMVRRLLMAQAITGPINASAKDK